MSTPNFALDSNDYPADEADIDNDMLPDDEPPEEIDPPEPSLDEPATSSSKKKTGRKNYPDRKSMDELPPLPTPLALSEVEVTDLTISTIRYQAVHKWAEDKREQGDDVSVMDPTVVEREVINLTNRYVHEKNKHLMAEEESLDFVKELTTDMLGEILKVYYGVVNVALAGLSAERQFDEVGVYMNEGPFAGLYVTDPSEIRVLARQFKPGITTGEFEQLQAYLHDRCDRVERCLDPDKVPFQNGILDYRAKELLPFNRKVVLVAKLPVDWNPAAKNVVIHNDEDGTDWDVESWMKGLGSEELVEFLWRNIGAVMRPNVRWHKCLFYLSEKGNNAKGTLVQLMRNLVGERNYMAPSLVQFASDTYLVNAPRAMAVLNDENDVDVTMDKAANFKAMVTGDVVTIDRKYLSSVKVRFRGLMIQCVNDKPKSRDKSESLYRRLVVVPFSQSFTGAERKYIKAEYLARTDVLEYVAMRALSGEPFYDFDDAHLPQECRDAMEEYRAANDAVRRFWAELREEFVWDLLPFPFLHELYQKWVVQNDRAAAAAFPISSHQFCTEITRLVENDDLFHVPFTESTDADGKTRTRPAQTRSAPSMNNHESLVDTWGLDGAWLLPNPNKHQSAKFKASYRGVVRRPGAPRPAGMPDPAGM